MNIDPIAYYHGPMTSKFGIPRQGGLVKSMPGRIVFEPPYRSADAVRGLDGFDYLWMIWGFSANSDKQQHNSGQQQPHNDSQEPVTPHSPTLTVRPPRLGGNERIGVFASRSPFRPNALGLTCAYINKVETDPRLGPVIHVSGADLMDGTPIYDIKPYVAYADSHSDARSGFVDSNAWQSLNVDIPTDIATALTEGQLQVLRDVLAQDPRPQYHNDPQRVYGMPFDGHNVRFTVSEGTVRVVEIAKTV